MSIPKVFAALAIAGATVWVAASAQEIPLQTSWHIKGQLTEACTCLVPCPCNFGERPAPYDYCYAMWSYWVREGRMGEIELDDLRIGGVEGAGGTLGLLDVRAEPEQRTAIEEIWHSLSGRLLCQVRLWPFKALGTGTSGQGSIIRTRYADRRFLGFEYITIEQEITARGARLTFGDRGGFEADYIFGRDAGQPVTVTNIVSWPLAVSIKGKTRFLKYKDEFNELDYQGTNANQGDFDLTQTQAGARPMTAPR